MSQQQITHSTNGSDATSNINGTNGINGVNGTENPHIRLATQEDVPEILAMIKELADFEKALDRVQATESSLIKTLSFAPTVSNPHPKPGYAYTLLLTLQRHDSATSESSKEQICGMAMYFNNYSTWTSCPGVYLEDLYVRPAYRRRGYATILFKKLAEEASRISDGKGRLEWNCLRWNQGALDLYAWLGGKRQEEWIGIRVEGEGLKKMALLEGGK